MTEPIVIPLHLTGLFLTVIQPHMPSSCRERLAPVFKRHAFPASVPFSVTKKHALPCCSHTQCSKSMKQWSCLGLRSCFHLLEHRPITGSIDNLEVYILKAQSYYILCTIKCLSKISKVWGLFFGLLFYIVVHRAINLILPFSFLPGPTAVKMHLRGQIVTGKYL